ncbi:MAG: hypothetical protein ACJA0U_002047 [Salibacteraceae bacterium]|jgi:hypothetical protein
MIMIHPYKCLLFLCAVLLTSNSYCQNPTNSSDATPLYKRITVGNPDKEILKTLDEIGVDLSCGAIFRNDSLQLELDDNTLLQLDEKGILYTVLIEDLTSYYSKSAVQDLPKARAELEEMKESSVKKKDHGVLKNVGQHDDCVEVDWAVPSNFNLNPNSSPNTFGGCLTYTQVLQELDDMRAQYPNLISLKLNASPTNQTTLEGRTVYYLRISDNPDVDEPSEPETLYQSLIHAREAGSIMQLLYYMWYILENYDTDDAIKALVNNQALYFIPVFNPDGFVYNEMQSPNGGGMQRKNRNDTGNGCSTFLHGIDLNRNSAYYWGNGGASTNPCSDTYLGTAPFSENETQIMRDFFLQHDFKLSMNHHSYKNAFLHGYAGTNSANPRPDEYSKYSHDMSYYNRYAYGPSTSISSLNSGNMNDWMLGGPAGTSSNGTPTGTGSGKNTLAWTPENGTSSEGGFWPAPSNFVGIAKRAMRANFLAAYFSGKYARLHDLNQSEITSLNGDLSFGIENLGQTASDFTVSVTPVSANILSTGSPNTQTGMSILDQNNVTISYDLDPTIQANDTIEFQVTLTNDYTSDNVLYETTIIKIYQPGIFFNDNPDVDGLSNWSASGGTWSVTSDSYSGSSAITSTLSPPYSNDETKTLQMNNSVNLEGADKALIQYYAKWDLERSFDYTQLEYSLNGASWTPICGKHTKPGASDQNNTYSGKSSSDNDFQPDDSPLYDGDTQGKWIMEEITIDENTNASLLGQSAVYLRFNFNTDGSNNQDAYYNANFEGFTFDDFKLLLIEGFGVGVNEINSNDLSIYPNPTSDLLTVELNGTLNINQLLIVDINGQVIYTNDNPTNSTLIVDTKNWSRGIYFVKIDGLPSNKIVKL